MKKLFLAVAVFSVSYVSYAFSAGDPGKAPVAKKERAGMKKSCDDLCEAIKSKTQEVNDFKDQAHEKGMEPKEKAKLQKKIANLKKDVTELKQELHKKKCPKCEMDMQTKEPGHEKDKEKEKE